MSRDVVYVAPPECLSAELLAAAIQAASTKVSVPLLGDRTGHVRWGHEVDAQIIDGLGKSPADIRKFSNYVSKYATGSTDPSGALDRRIRSEVDIARRELTPHLRRLVQTAWDLGGEEELAGLGLRNWAHALGFRGHWLTKSRRYSTTFGALRAERAAWTAATNSSIKGGDPLSARTRESKFDYAGRGWLTRGDAVLATSLNEERSQARRAAREEWSDGGDD